MTSQIEDGWAVQCTCHLSTGSNRCQPLSVGVESLDDVRGPIAGRSLVPFVHTLTLVAHTVGARRYNTNESSGSVHSRTREIALEGISEGALVNSSPVDLIK